MSLKSPVDKFEFDAALDKDAPAGKRCPTTIVSVGLWKLSQREPLDVSCKTRFPISVSTSLFACDLSDGVDHLVFPSWSTIVIPLTVKSIFPESEMGPSRLADQMIVLDAS